MHVISLLEKEFGRTAIKETTFADIGDPARDIGFDLDPRPRSKMASRDSQNAFASTTRPEVVHHDGAAMNKFQP